MFSYYLNTLINSKRKIFWLFLTLLVFNFSFFAPIINTSVYAQSINKQMFDDFTKAGDDPLTGQPLGQAVAKQSTGWFSSIVSSLTTGFTGLGLSIVGYVAYAIAWCTYYIADMSVRLLGYVLSNDFIKYSYTNPKNNPIIETGLAVTQSFVNMMLVVFLVYIALGTILRMSTFRDKKVLYLFVVMALLVNFSPVICGIIVDASNIAMKFFIFGDAQAGVGVIQGKGMGSSLTTIIKETIDAAASGLISDMWSPAQKIDNILDRVAILIVMSIMLVFLAIVYMLYTVVFTVRYFAIWILVILSPISFVSYILPQTKSMIWSKWWSQFVAWCTIGVTCAFFLYLAGQFGTVFVKLKSDTKATAVIPAKELALPKPENDNDLYKASIIDYTQITQVDNSIYSGDPDTDAWIKEQYEKTFGESAPPLPGDQNQLRTGNPVVDEQIDNYIKRATGQTVIDKTNNSKPTGTIISKENLPTKIALIFTPILFLALGLFFGFQTSAMGASAIIGATKRRATSLATAPARGARWGAKQVPGLAANQTIRKFAASNAGLKTAQWLSNRSQAIEGMNAPKPVKWALRALNYPTFAQLGTGISKYGVSQQKAISSIKEGYSKKFGKDFKRGATAYNSILPGDWQSEIALAQYLVETKGAKGFNMLSKKQQKDVVATTAKFQPSALEDLVKHSPMLAKDKDIGPIIQKNLDLKEIGANQAQKDANYVEQMIEKLKPDDYKNLSDDVLENNSALNSIIKNAMGSHINQLVNGLGQPAAEAIEKHIKDMTAQANAKLKSLGQPTMSNLDYVKKKNARLHEYLQSTAARGLINI